MPLGFGDGGFDAMLKKAAANAKVAMRDVAKGGSTMVAKLSETDMKGSARRMTNKVLERAEGGNFTLVEEIPEVWRASAPPPSPATPAQQHCPSLGLPALPAPRSLRAERSGTVAAELWPQVESAMVNLKQTDTAYWELLAVLKDSFIAQSRAVSRQLRVANRAEIIGRDLESEQVGSALCSYSAHLVTCSEKAQELNSIKESAEVEEKARDDFAYRVYETPVTSTPYLPAPFLRLRNPGNLQPLPSDLHTCCVYETLVTPTPYVATCTFFAPTKPRRTRTPAVSTKHG